MMGSGGYASGILIGWDGRLRRAAIVVRTRAAYDGNRHTSPAPRAGPSPVCSCPWPGPSRSPAASLRDRLAPDLDRPSSVGSQGPDTRNPASGRTLLCSSQGALRHVSDPAVRAMLRSEPDGGRVKRSQQRAGAYDHGDDD